MLNHLFIGALILYLLSVIINFLGVAFLKNKTSRIVLIAFLAGFALHTAYFVSRGITAGRLPMANQFEFAMSFSWGISLMYIIMKFRFKADWITNYALPAAFLMLLYASILPREIRELMPALRSRWFGIHIGSAVVAYAAFTLSACAGVKYLFALKKGETEDSLGMRQMDFFSYRLVILGILGLTICILSGAVWGEEAWSSFWQWDPKELWSLITWIVYAIYLHQRLRMKWHGKRMAIFAIVAVGFVLFTFIGVNTLLPGLHSFYV